MIQIDPVLNWNRCLVSGHVGVILRVLTFFTGFKKMLITLKTLQQKVFKVEVELSEDVSTLKDKIASVGKEDHGGDYPRDKQKLIFQVFLTFPFRAGV